MPDVHQTTYQGFFSSFFFSVAVKSKLRHAHISSVVACKVVIKLSSALSQSFVFCFCFSCDLIKSKLYSCAFFSCLVYDLKNSDRL